MLSIRRTTVPAGLALSGEIDESTYPRLVQALEELADRGQTVHLDLSGVQYCDVAGLRALITLATADGDAGRSLVLHAVPRPLRTTLRILGWDATPGVTMEER